MVEPVPLHAVEDDGDRSSRNLVAENYDASIQRAQIREQIRAFVDKTKDSWRGYPSPNLDRHQFATLDEVMKFGTLGSFRRLELADYLSDLMLIGTAVSALLMGALFFPQTETVAMLVGAPTLLAAGLTALALLLFLLDALLAHKMTRLHGRMNNYLGEVAAKAERLVYEIEAYVGEVSDEITDGTRALTFVAISQREAGPIREGIVKALTNWRKLERLPFYLRTEWDLYLSDISDARFLPSSAGRRVAARAVEIVALGGLAALGLAVMIGETAGLVSDMVLTAAIALPLANAAFVLAVHIQRRRAGRAGLSPLSPLLAAGFAALAVGLSFLLPVGSQVEAGRAVLAGLIGFSGLSGLLALLHSARAGAGYKMMADVAMVRIMLALRTHKKRRTLALLSPFGLGTLPKLNAMRTFVRFERGRFRAPEDWDGWTEEFGEVEAERRLADGATDEESVAIASNPAIYVGNEKSLRAIVTRKDPTLTFVQKFPFISGGRT